MLYCRLSLLLFLSLLMTYICSGCNRSFDTSRGLKGHWRGCKPHNERLLVGLKRKAEEEIQGGAKRHTSSVPPIDAGPSGNSENTYSLEVCLAESIAENFLKYQTLVER